MHVRSPAKAGAPCPGPERVELRVGNHLIYRPAANPFLADSQPQDGQINRIQPSAIAARSRRRGHRVKRRCPVMALSGPDGDFE